MSDPSVRGNRHALDALARSLGDGETLLVYCEGLVRIRLQLFEKCGVALTGERVMIFRPAWPLQFKLADSYPRHACRIVREKVRIDGTRLAILRHPGGVTCLYFPRHWREQADSFCEELAAPQPADEDPVVRADALDELRGLSAASPTLPRDPDPTT